MIVEQDNSSRQREAWERESDWGSLAIASAVIAVVLAGFAYIWIFHASSSTDEMLKRSQAFAPFGILLIAGVTYCTVLWRGLISARQADTGLQQVDEFRRQIAATQENNLALLLEKGAELLDDTAGKAKVAGGIAILRSVATDANPKFSIEAMNLLADFMRQHESQQHGPLFDATYDALAAGADLGRISLRQVTFKAPDKGGAPWRLVRGIKYVRYDGGTVLGDRFKGNILNGDTEYRFTRTSIMGGIVDTRLYFFNCAFQNAKITGASFKKQHLGKNENIFGNCSFSDAIIENAASFPDMRPFGSYYISGRPPRGDEPVSWQEKLLERPPTTPELRE